MARTYKLPAADKYEVRWSGLGYEATEDHTEALGYFQALDAEEALRVAREHQHRGAVFISCVKNCREISLAVMQDGVLRRWTG